MEIFRKCAERTVMKDFCCAVLITEDRCEEVITHFDLVPMIPHHDISDLTHKPTTD